jgi:hypothetical protein
LLAECDLLIDVGANTGQFAERMRAFWLTRRMISFEPSLDAFTVPSVRSAKTTTGRSGARRWAQRSVNYLALMNLFREHGLTLVYLEPSSRIPKVAQSFSWRRCSAASDALLDRPDDKFQRSVVNVELATSILDTITY